MMNRFFAPVLAALLLLALASCSGPSDGRLVTPVGPGSGEEEAGEDLPSVPETPENPDPPAAPVYETGSGEGYLFEYSPDAFEKTGDDTWTYTAQTLLPVYIAVQRLPDRTPEDTAAGLALQSGSDTAVPRDVYFGSEGVEALHVHVEKAVDGATQIQDFYAMSYKGGTLLVEAGTYAGAPEQADDALKIVLDSFVPVTD